LLVEITQDAQGGALVDHTAALPPPAGVAGALPPGAKVGDGAVGGGGLADEQVLFTWRRLRLLARAGGGDGDWHGTWHGRLYSHGGRHIGIGGTKHLVDKGGYVVCNRDDSRA